jgi:hypothetical protein
MSTSPIKTLPILLVLACSWWQEKPTQLPLGGDRECSWSPDIAVQCCYAHDNSYWIGGAEEDRLWADRELYWCMRSWGVPMPIALAYYVSVQQFGQGSWTYHTQRTRRGNPPPDPFTEYEEH